MMHWIEFAVAFLAVAIAGNRYSAWSRKRKAEVCDPGVVTLRVDKHGQLRISEAVDNAGAVSETVLCAEDTERTLNLLRQAERLVAKEFAIDF